MSDKGVAATQIISDPLGRRTRDVGEYRLLETGGAGANVDVLVTKPRFTLGSHRGNDLLLDDASVSRFHAELVATPAGFLLRDLDSTNGSWVDDLRINEAYLPERCALRLGQRELGFALTGARVTLPGSESSRFHGLIGASPAMREIFSLLARVGPTGATVLLEGESGTGKELVARALVEASDRRGAPLVVLDCAAVPRNLIESELFGHEKGAFTGADTLRPGCFERADGGTLFLDELGELPLDLQPKLLRVLESRELRRLGGTQTKKVDVRLVAATNRDLAREVNRGAFRADLYYRLAVVRIELPPLRDRVEDIRPLAEHFVRRLVSDPRRRRRIIGGISEANWKRLEKLRWPGNVRELRNFIERTLLLSEADDQLGLSRAGLPAITLPRSTGLAASALTAVDLERPFRDVKAETVEAFERAYLFGQLAQHENNVSAAARAAGLDRMNFKRLLKKHQG